MGLSATIEEVHATAEEYGFEVVEAICCFIQGVHIVLERPVGDNESFFGLKLAGPTTSTEIIENHYCPGDADDAEQEITWGRACQRAVWAMESHGR